jgi:hypothetical protein
MCEWGASIRHNVLDVVFVCTWEEHNDVVKYLSMSGYNHAVFLGTDERAKMREEGPISVRGMHMCSIFSLAFVGRGFLGRMGEKSMTESRMWNPDVFRENSNSLRAGKCSSFTPCMREKLIFQGGTIM